MPFKVQTLAEIEKVSPNLQPAAVQGSRTLIRRIWFGSRYQILSFQEGKYSIK
ncbi:hypothetical protein PAL_GLEAN10025031 [Pteropus alecto]|uniref:Uncharacterized protein n=1 Tax=Pteropus alecto TaxID=9402 RepID=L5KIS1_PTEAL|nr:hypothetical protein PAL_GLEAN10025031 [Pteropus alecto]